MTVKGDEPSIDTPIIFGIGHQAGAGKDTLATALWFSSEMPTSFHKGQGLRFKSGLTAALDAFFESAGVTPPDWENKTPEVRSALQVGGTDLGRAYDRDIWVKAAQKRTTEIWNDYDVIWFTDMRFPNELDFIKRHGGYTIDVVAPRNQREQRLKRQFGEKFNPASLDHESERALDGADFDIVVYNADGKDIQAEADNIWRRILAG